MSKSRANIQLSSYDDIFGKEPKDNQNVEKKSDLDRVTLKNEVLKKYFPKSYTPKQMEDTIIKLLEQWQKKRNRDKCL